MIRPIGRQFCLMTCVVVNAGFPDFVDWQATNTDWYEPSCFMTCVVVNAGFYDDMRRPIGRQFCFMTCVVVNVVGICVRGDGSH